MIRAETKQKLKAVETLEEVKELLKDEPLFRPGPEVLRFDKGIMGADRQRNWSELGKEDFLRGPDNRLLHGVNKENQVG